MFYASRIIRGSNIIYMLNACPALFSYYHSILKRKCVHKLNFSWNFDRNFAEDTMMWHSLEYICRETKENWCKLYGVMKLCARYWTGVRFKNSCRTRDLPYLRWLVASTNRDGPVSLRGIIDKQRGPGTSFSLSSRAFLFQLEFNQCSIFIYQPRYGHWDH